MRELTEDDRNAIRRVAQLWGPRRVRAALTAECQHGWMDCPLALSYGPPGRLYQQLRKERIKAYQAGEANENLDYNLVARLLSLHPADVWTMVHLFDDPQVRRDAFQELKRYA
jgi:hypothetical protein